MKTLDALVAERVMGWVWWNNSKGDWKGDDNVTFWTFWDDCLSVYQNGSETPTWYWSPSTDIAAAWQVVEKMAESFYVKVDYAHPTSCWCGVIPRSLGKMGEANCASAPLAICIAALRAVGISQDEIDAAMKQEMST